MPIFPMQSSEFTRSLNFGGTVSGKKHFRSEMSEVIRKKTHENYQNCYVVEKRISSILPNVSIPNFDGTICRLEYRLCQNFTLPSFSSF